MGVILVFTLIGVVVLLLVYKTLTEEGARVAEGVEQQASPLWDASLPVK